MVDGALREGVIGIAQAAGRAILEIYLTGFEVARKDDDSPLTQADLVAHRRILDGLRRLTPDIPVLSEESAPADIAARRRWPRLWLVDPLDGTREFIKRNGEFTVNIALVEGDTAVFGVVHQPVSGRLWHGGAHGAWARDGALDLAVRVAEPSPRPLRVAASRSHRDARTQAFLEALGEVEPVACGSSLKFCRIAEGAIDLYPRFGPTSEWDTAAGQAILEAAGGAVTDLHGRPLRYNRRDSLLNGDFMAWGDPALKAILPG